MLQFLLDSHVLLWWDSDLSKLSEGQREAISEPGNEVFVSAVTGWELGIKRSTGKLVLIDSIGGLAQRFGFFEVADHDGAWRVGGFPPAASQRSV